jgi:small-conductance mechanosensitive channel
MTGPVFAIGLVGGAVAVHLGLRRVARRVPRWLAARRGLDTGGGSAPAEGAIALACFVARVGVWIAVVRVLSAHYWIVHGLRARFESAVGMSVTAPLFAIGEHGYSLADLVRLMALLAVVWIGIGMIARTVRRQLGRLSGQDRGVQDAVTVVIRYALSLLATIVLFQAWGIDVSSLTIVASVLGVGIGFGMQNIANNLVSGFLLTLERPIKRGDFVKVGELMGTVERIGARSTEVRTLDRVSILVPNASFLEKEVVNWSHGDPVSRIHVPVSIEYGADLRRARAAMLEAARGHRDVLADPRPSVELGSFGENGIEMTLFVWTRDPARQNRLRSDLNFAIFDAFARHAVTIPFPQQDVHLHAPALERVATAWARRHFTPDELAAAESRGGGGAADPLPELLEERTPSTWSDVEIADVVERMRGPGGVAIEDRRHLLTTYPRTFVGAEAVAWLRDRLGLTRDEAVQVGTLLVERRLVHHVLDEHGFEDGNFFFRFYADEPPVPSARGDRRDVA